MMHQVEVLDCEISFCCDLTTNEQDLHKKFERISFQINIPKIFVFLLPMDLSLFHILIIGFTINIAFDEVSQGNGCIALFMLIH